jgi:hypothetical protein
VNRGQLVFKAEGSVRYHRARASYFSSLNKWLTAASFFLGAGVVVTTLAAIPSLTLTSGMIVALINAYRFAAKPDQAARDHEKLCHDWAELLGLIRAQPEPGEKQLRKWIASAHQLDGACLEDMKAVKAHVYNETMTTLGLSDEPYKLSAFQRATKHVLPHTHSFDQQNLEATRNRG